MGDQQRTEGHERGSWRPSGEAEGPLGRVAVTALNMLILEMASGYQHVFR